MLSLGEGWRETCPCALRVWRPCGPYMYGIIRTILEDKLWSPMCLCRDVRWNSRLKHNAIGCLYMTECKGGRERERERKGESMLYTTTPTYPRSSPYHAAYTYTLVIVLISIQKISKSPISFPQSPNDVVEISFLTFFLRKLSWGSWVHLKD